MFGEMCGLYLAHMYELSGKPADAVVAELGPGRGTLMRDMRHAWSALMPELAAAPVHLVETSPVLRSIQNGTIGESAPVTWHADTDELVAGIEGPLFGIANEFFDALPAAQLVWRTAAGIDAWSASSMTGSALWMAARRPTTRPFPTRRRTAWSPSSARRRIL